MSHPSVEDSTQQPGLSPLATLSRWALFLVILIVLTVMLLDTSTIVRVGVMLVLVMPIALMMRGWLHRRTPGAWLRQHPWIDRHSATLAHGLLWFAIISFCAAAIQLRPDADFSTSIWLILGLIAIPIAYELRPWPPSKDRLRQATTYEHSARWALVAIGTLAFVLLTLVNLRGSEFKLNVWAQGMLLISGVVLVGCGFWGHWHGVRQRLNAHFVALILVLLLAAVVRLYNLEWWTMRWLDELLFSNAIVDLRQPDRILMLKPFSGITAFSWAYPMLQALFASILGPGLLPLRLTSAFFGILTVAATYQLGRVQFDKRVGLVAAVIMATLPVHLQFSRIGIANIADPLFGVLALLFVARGLRRPSMRDYALAGLMLGLTQYFYEGGRIFFPLLVASWLVFTRIFARQGASYTPPKLRHLMALAFCFLILAAPLYLTWASWDARMLPRYNTTRAIWNTSALNSVLEEWFERIPVVMRVFVQLHDYSWFYGGTQPILLLPLVPFFFLGIAHSLARLLKPGGSLLVGWIAAGIVGIALIDDAWSYPRYMVLLPGLALCIGLGAIKTWDTFNQRRDARMLSINARPAWIAAAFIVTIMHIGYYFGIHIPNFYEDQYGYKTQQGIIYRDDIEDALWRVLGLPPETHVHIVSGNKPWDFNIEAVRTYFYREDLTIETIDPQSFEAKLMEMSPFDHHAFFLSKEDDISYQLMTMYFLVQDRVYKSPFNIPEEATMDLYFAPAIWSLNEDDGVMQPDLPANASTDEQP
ncbi:glycosyltransferase family 39 protein [Phototrophicus methaneseepsis]|uniref:Glycosyltransferase family 39 protein n=1 Tax=Phototrophicus methaneseepsis TaxID=2710758 RepID=A0A7S8EBG5_9CHLR|nr:glycosyltransferase family 39 protein [Phototrophicus methaneseepsis]QPC83886.1 glycosyltransferase family 39 protein [Phototrophicus methaneseepsis]